MSQEIPTHQISTTQAQPRHSTLQWLALLLIRGYQRFVSPLTPPSCRYTPTCSSYAKQAIEQYGWRLGSWMAFLRIVRCHPFHPGGVDPVPCAHDVKDRPRTPD